MEGCPQWGCCEWLWLCCYSGNVWMTLFILYSTVLLTSDFIIQQCYLKKQTVKTHSFWVMDAFWMITCRYTGYASSLIFLCPLFTVGYLQGVLYFLVRALPWKEETSWEEMRETLRGSNLKGEATLSQVTLIVWLSNSVKWIEKRFSVSRLWLRVQ